MKEIINVDENNKEFEMIYSTAGKNIRIKLSI